ncbi:MAG: putative 4-hydroxybenzoate polyprenyltransferase [Actinomycetota bacterium]|nr:putative 4-hydroxybenzoate polyprenyltransferase [Actinomycetota bacterium]
MNGPLTSPVPRLAAGRFLSMIAFEHSVFALPFALLAVWAATDGRPAAGDVGWVVVAMIAARTFAMATNRIVDREFDALNPRTAKRELVTGAVTLGTAWTGTLLSVAAFVVAVSQLHPIVWPLAPIALAALALYPYLKRWTWACHFGLGLAQSVAPVGAWLAVSGEWSAAAVALGLSVGLWMAGFDLIYATQDVAVDRRLGVHSIPADFSVSAALTLARVVHVGTVGLWVAFGLLDGRGPLWWGAAAGGALMLAYEHHLVQPDDLSRVDRAFFTVNGWVAIGVGLLGILDTAVVT